MRDETWQEARALALAGLAILGVVLLLLLAIQLRQILAILFLGVVLGVSLNPIVSVLGRAKLPEVAAVLLVYFVLAMLFAAFVWYAAREVASESLDLQLEQIRGEYETFQRGTSLPTSDDIESGLGKAASGAASGAIGKAFSFVSGVLYFFTVLFTALLFSVTQDRMRALLLSFLNPGARSEFERVLHVLAHRLRRFMVGELIAMVAIGITTYVGLLIIGIKFPLILGFLAFLTEVLPLIGPWIAFIPAFAIALTQGLWSAIAVVLLFLLIQGFENYVVTPVVHGHESQMPALLILVALLCGGTLMGVLGALIALPLAVIAHTLFFEVVIPWNERRLAGDNEVVLAGD